MIDRYIAWLRGHGYANVKHSRVTLDIMQHAATVRYQLNALPDLSKYLQGE